MSPDVSQELQHYGVKCTVSRQTPMQKLKRFSVHELCEQLYIGMNRPPWSPGVWGPEGVEQQREVMEEN